MMVSTTHEPEHKPVLSDQAVELTVLPLGADRGLVLGRLSHTEVLPQNIFPSSNPLPFRNFLTKGGTLCIS